MSLAADLYKVSKFREELVDRICSGVEERTFKQKVKDTPEIKIDKKGRVIH